MRTDRHIVYAVLDTPKRKQVRLSAALPWDQAQAAHRKLDREHYDRQRTLYVGNRRVLWLAVRSDVDPGWPASGPLRVARLKRDLPHAVALVRQPRRTTRPAWTATVTVGGQAFAADAANPVAAQAEARKLARLRGAL